jgi:hypothetical protein
MLGAEGVRAMEVRVGGGAEVTVRLAVPLTPPSVAVTVVAPEATAVARPPVLIVAVAVAELVQVTAEVILRVEPSL